MSPMCEGMKGNQTSNGDESSAVQKLTVTIAAVETGTEEPCNPTFKSVNTDASPIALRCEAIGASFEKGATHTYKKGFTHKRLIF